MLEESSHGDILHVHRQLDPIRIENYFRLDGND
jgi:hypothetical protein